MDIQAIENLSNSVAYTSTPGYTHITVPNCMREKKPPRITIALKLIHFCLKGACILNGEIINFTNTGHFNPYHL